MNAALNTEYSDFMKILIVNGLIQDFSNTIKKVDVLRYYRETKLAFLNLGSLIISENDGRVYLFNQTGELICMNCIEI